jgi:predicted nucleotidyltransferase
MGIYAINISSMYIFEFNPPIEIHNELNPALWDDGKIRREIQVKLLKIAKEFYGFLDVSTRIDDILITGSQANYNYTRQSDIDLHLIVDFSQVDCEGEVRELFDTKRKLWKQNHDINIKGIPVECYVEDLNDPAVTASYSIIKETWIRQPNKMIKDYDREKVEELATMWSKVIDNAISSDELEVMQVIKNSLAVFRKKSLARDGEFGSGNLAFKALRNSDYISRLMTAINDKKDQLLSL